MTEAEQVARELAEWSGFEWRAGMLNTAGCRVLVVGPDGVPVEWAFAEPDSLHRVITGHGTPGWCAECWEHETPDLTDDATAGVLVGMLPEGSTVLRLQEGWMVRLGGPPPDGLAFEVWFSAPCLGEAVARALMGVRG